MEHKAKKYFDDCLNEAEDWHSVEEVDMVEDAKFELLKSIGYSLAIIADHLTGAEQDHPKAMNNKFNTVEPDEK